MNKAKKRLRLRAGSKGQKRGKSVSEVPRSKRLRVENLVVKVQSGSARVEGAATMARLVSREFDTLTARAYV